MSGSKGFKLEWRDEEGEKIGYLSWNTVEAEIGALIMTGQYYTPEVAKEPDIDLAEDEDENRPLTDDEIEEILEADRQRYEELSRAAANMIFFGPVSSGLEVELNAQEKWCDRRCERYH